MYICGSKCLAKKIDTLQGYKTEPLFLYTSAFVESF